MAIAVSIVEDDAQARKILAGWINRASGFRLAGDWGDVTRCEGITGQFGQDGAATPAACVPTFPPQAVV